MRQRSLRVVAHVAATPTSAPASNETVEVYEHVVAPCLKDLGLCEFSASKGRSSVRLPANPKWYFSGGAICGLIIVDAVDTVVSLAMFTMDRLPKGTVYHHTHFLRAAARGDFVIQAEELRCRQGHRIRGSDREVFWQWRIGCTSKCRVRLLGTTLDAHSNGVPWLLVAQAFSSEA